MIRCTNCSSEIVSVAMGCPSGCQPTSGFLDSSGLRSIPDECFKDPIYHETPIEIKGIKYDQEKPNMSLLSSIAITKVAEVMTYGEKKYSSHNWRAGLAWSRVLSASLRHIFAYLGGESLDPETGKSHIAHAVCCLMMLLEFEETKKEFDDRFKQEKENGQS